MTDLITVEIESDIPLTLDFTTFVLTQQYTNDGDQHEPICGMPELPISLDKTTTRHSAQYGITCAEGFKSADKKGINHSMICSTDMKWRGSPPQCVPEKTCPKLSNGDTTEVFQYKKSLLLK